MQGHHRYADTLRISLRGLHVAGGKVNVKVLYSTFRSVNRSVESCSYSFTLCRVYIGNDD